MRWSRWVGVALGIWYTALCTAASGQQAQTQHIGPAQQSRHRGKEMTSQPTLSGSRGKVTQDLGNSNQTGGARGQAPHKSPGPHTARAAAEPAQREPVTETVADAGRRDDPAPVRVILDTDAKNEIDDQHYIAYALYSELKVVAINSAHHGGLPGEEWQEAMNWAEIKHILDLARCSGLPAQKLPPVYRGSPHRLRPPASGRWTDIEPQVSPASEAILAAARSTPPGDPVWVVPVGPCTNVASAILQARREGLDLRGRLRICWLGGSPKGALEDSFNGGNDPWAAYVVAQSRLPFWVILERPTGASLKVDTRREAKLYPDNPLGRYLLSLTNPLVLRRQRPKSLYDVTAIGTVLALTRNLPWLLRIEPATLLGPDERFAWEPGPSDSPLRIIRDIDADAIKDHFFRVLHRGEP